MNKFLSFVISKFAIYGWKRLLYAFVFVLILWQLIHMSGVWTESTSIFYYIHAPIHEVGHAVAQLLFSSSRQIVILAGSIFQELTPIAIGIYFAFRNDYPALSLCLGWLGFATIEMGAYMYDANIQQLELVAPFVDCSDAEGDFTQLFRMWGCLDAGCRIGTITARIGFCFVFMALLMIVAMYIMGFIYPQNTQNTQKD